VHRVEALPELVAQELEQKGFPAGVSVAVHQQSGWFVHGDEVFVLELDSPTRLTFELTDYDETRAIDTVLYIRSACEDMASQVACADDVPCGTSTVPGGPTCTGSGAVDVRQSRVTLTLPAGRYYVVADAFVRRGDGVNYTCGRVRLSVHFG